MLMLPGYELKLKGRVRATVAIRHRYLPAVREAAGKCTAILIPELSNQKRRVRFSRGVERGYRMTGPRLQWKISYHVVNLSHTLDN